MTLRLYATLVVVVAVSVSLAAQGAKSEKTKALRAAGIVTSVSGGSLVIEGTGKKSMTFTVDPSTHILKRGATAKTKEKQAAGAAGLIITDVVHQGDQVTVRYRKAGTAMTATEVRVASR